MAKQRTPDLPGDMFDNNSAISRLTGGTGRSKTVEPVSERPGQSETPPETKIAVPAKESQNRNLKQTSFYLFPEQLIKLDDLAHAHYKRTGHRINRNDIIRHLVDRCQLNDIADLS